MNTIKLLSLAVALGLSAIAYAQQPGCGLDVGCQGGCDTGCCDTGCRKCPACPKCSSKVCIGTPVCETEKKHCFRVECKEICIPKFVWPWHKKSCGGCGHCNECCGPPRCGKVKVVKVLKKEEYDCPKCGYKFELHEACGCNTGCSTCTDLPVESQAPPTGASYQNNGEYYAPGAANQDSANSLHTLTNMLLRK